MSSLLYFLPKVTLAQVAPQNHLARSLVESRGLKDALGDCRDLGDVAYCEIVGHGPDGGPGLVVSPLPVKGRRPPRSLGFYPESNDWTRINDGLWIGRDRVWPPSPEDLQRREIFPGEEITLGDGNRWTVPTLRQVASGQPTLPRDCFWDDDGNFVTELRHEYRELWCQVERVARYFYEPASDEFRSMGLEEGVAICLAALALNYRVGRAEERILRLITSTNCEEVLGAIVDYRGFERAVAELEAAQKKSESRASAPSSRPGAAACPPATVPPGASCTSPGSSLPFEE